jgi:threonine dehydrogenase-like Zn-dependent dehydrogenase
MQALVVDTAATPRLTYHPDRPEPTPPPGELLIRVDLAGICATDLEIVRGYMQFTGIPGHEFVGTVAAGPPEWLGRRVVGEINAPCGTCDLCTRGLPTHCRRRTVLGIAGRDGAFAEYLCLPPANCHRVPDHVPDVAAVFVEPLAAAVQVIRQCPVDAGMRVSVLGSGRLGLLVGAVLADAGAAPLVIGRNPRSLAVAAQLGLRTARLAEVQPAADYDVVVDCTGAPDGLRLAQQLVRPRGTIVLKSTYAEPAPLDLAPLVIHEITVIGSRCGPFDAALELLARGAIDVGPLVSATYPLSEGVPAFEAAAGPDCIKVLLRPGT